MSFITFSTVATDIPVKDKGIYVGWKLTTVMHGGRKINVSDRNYYYIPYNSSLVSYRGTKATILKTTDGYFNLTEKLLPRGSWHFKVDCFYFLDQSKRILG
jgi:hypothetical protein